MTKDEAMDRAKLLHCKISAALGTQDLEKVRDEIMAIFADGEKSGYAKCFADLTPSPGTIKLLSDNGNGARTWLVM